MHATRFRRPRPLAFIALTALSAALAAPATGLAADEVDWGFRDNFRSYINSGNGTPPISASNGATCDPNPNTTKGGCDPKIGTVYGVFGWTATDSSYALPSGAGTIESQGTILFSHPAHFFTLSVVDPIFTIASNGDAVLNARLVLVVTGGTVPPIDQRMNFGEFTLSNPVQVTSSTVTWDLGNGAISQEAADALGGFLAAGSALDPVRITLPLEAAAGTPLSSTKILLKDDGANPDKRGLTVVVAKQPLVVATDFDPTVDGAFVRVLGDSFEDGYLLPASNWSPLLKKGVVSGYKYADRDRVLGPIFMAEIKAGLLKVLGKGAGLGHGLGTEPATLTVVFESGNGTYLCLGVGDGSKTAYKAGKLYKGAKNPAPASCPAWVAY